MTAIPNFCLNAPPHHLSWWNEAALRALAAMAGLVVREVALLPAAPGQPLIHWMGRLAPFKAPPDGPYFAPRTSWYASLLAAYWAGRIVAPIRRISPASAPHFVLLVAQKPLR